MFEDGGEPTAAIVLFYLLLSALFFKGLTPLNSLYFNLFKVKHLAYFAW